MELMDDEALDRDVDALLRGSFLFGQDFDALCLDVKAEEGRAREGAPAAAAEELELEAFLASDERAVVERRIGAKAKRDVLGTHDGGRAAPPLPGAARAQGTAVSQGRNDDGCTLVLRANPPTCALAHDLALLHRPSQSQNEWLQIAQQPPLEIRTRTRNENRTFSCVVAVKNIPPGCQSASVQLCYATEPSVLISTLGGTLSRPIVNDSITFDDLSISVASPKHAEKEFVLRIALDGVAVGAAPPAHTTPVYSTPFYAFSHKSVLKRRREVSLRAISHSAISRSAAESQAFHVIGSPFVRSDRLQCVFRVRRADCDQAMLDDASSCDPLPSEAPQGEHDREWISLRAQQLEVFSESALFFRSPSALLRTRDDICAYVQVTNDGRNFSNPMPVTILADVPPSPKRTCTIRSRM